MLAAPANYSRLQPLLISSTASIPAQTFYPHYWNNLHNVLPGSVLALHLSIINIVTRLVSLKHKSDYISPLVKLQELPMSLKMEVKVCWWGFMWSSHHPCTSHYPSEPFYHCPLTHSALATPTALLLLQTQACFLLEASALSAFSVWTVLPLQSQISRASLRSYAHRSCPQQGLPWLTLLKIATPRTEHFSSFFHVLFFSISL